MGEITGATGEQPGVGVGGDREGNTVWADSLAGPGADDSGPAGDGLGPGILQTPPSSAPLVKLGASLTGVMSMEKLWVGEVSSPPLRTPPSSER